MNKSRRVALAAACALGTLLLGARAAAEPISPKEGELIHIQSPSSVKTDGGSEIRLPPSFCIDEAGWDKLDLEVHRLQEAETRLKAENKSLRKSASSEAFSFGWKSLTSAVVLGLAAGYWIAER